MTDARRERRVCVLGAGIMGSSLALFLARRGMRVTLVDEAPAPMARASRWNEGKIHLGYLYSGDASLATAHRLLAGGLAFAPLVEELTGRSLRDVTTRADDHFLLHRDSVVGLQSMRAYFEGLSELVRSHPESGRYLTDLGNARAVELARHELAEISRSPEILAGFRVPERSVQTNRVADWLVEALLAEPRIEFQPATRVFCADEGDAGWSVVADPPLPGGFDIVVNALWQGQSAVDGASGFVPRPAQSYRYRLSLFVKTRRSVDAPSAVIATGPFGDVKNYDGTNFYLSWYPVGLVVDQAEPIMSFRPEQDADTVAKVTAGTVDGLKQLLPDIASIVSDPAEMAVKGGWVVAQGGGSLADPGSPLHRRDRFGIARMGSYISIDTGKYSTAPWLARRIADELAG